MLIFWKNSCIRRSDLVTWFDLTLFADLQAVFFCAKGQCNLFHFYKIIMIKQSIKIGAIALLLATGFVACQKEGAHKQLAQNSKLITLNGTLDNPPTVDDGVMKFNNKEELNSYLDYLDNLQKDNSVENEGINVDSVLQSIEDGYGGFTSLRKSELDSHVTGTDADGEPEYDYEAINSSTITGYASLKSVLNSNREVNVDNNLIVYLDNDNQIEIKNPDLIPQVREAILSTSDKLEQLEKIEEIEFDNGSENIVLISATSVNPSIDITNGNFNTSVSFDPCAKKVIIRNIFSSNLSTCRIYHTQPPVHIVWGDGQTEDKNSSNTNYSDIWFGAQACDIHNAAKRIKYVEHNYPNNTTGVKTLSLLTDWWPIPKQYSLDFDATGCSNSSKVVFGYSVANGGTDKLYARLEVINGFLTHRVIAESVSYKKKGNGWNKDKSYISTKITGAIKNNNCGTTENVDKFEDWNSSKSATITVGNGGSNELYYTQFNSEHRRKARNNEQMEIDLTLNSCGN